MDPVGWIKSLFASLTGSNRDRSNQLLDQKWGALEQLWLACKASSPPPPATDAGYIDGLFTASGQGSDSARWTKLNEAERRVGSFLPPAQLRIQYGLLLQAATARSLANLAFHTANKPLFDDPAKADEQRAAYQALLGDLQKSFIDARFRRQLRSEVAQRLFVYGLVTLAVAALLPLLLVSGDLGNRAVQAGAGAPAVQRFSNEPVFPLILVAAFGLLGAYFSRAIAFQSNIATLTFDNVMQLYVGRVLRMRMLYGTIGAVIFYFMIRGGLVGGDIFPDLSRLGIVEQPVLRIGDDGAVSKTGAGRLVTTGLTVIAPTADLAKLIVWSFLAGFSERLVPDALTRTEAEGSQARQ